MAHAKEKQSFYKLTVWINEAQYNQLVKLADGQKFSDYTRNQMFPAHKRAITINPQQAAHIIALLGKTRLHSNINQIAHDIHCGTASFSDKTELYIHEVANDIKDIRRRLITLTGKKA